jgi:hypothetical protein
MAGGTTGRVAYGLSVAIDAVPDSVGEWVLAAAAVVCLVVGRSSVPGTRPSSGSEIP